MALDHQAVGLRRYGGLGQRHDQVPPSRGVRGVHDHRQVRKPLGDDDRREIQREARARLERTDAPLAKDNVVPAGGGHVLRGEQPLLDRRREPRFKTTPWSVPAIAAPTRFSSEKFAMLRAPICRTCACSMTISMS